MNHHQHAQTETIVKIWPFELVWPYIMEHLA